MFFIFIAPTLEEGNHEKIHRNCVFCFSEKKKRKKVKINLASSILCRCVYIYIHEKINNIQLKQQNHLTVCDLFSKCVSQCSGYGGGK